MITRKQQDRGMGMIRVLFMVSVTLLVSHVNDQCEASDGHWRRSVQFDKLYHRTLAICQDKLDQWNNVSTLPPESPSSTTHDSNVSSYGSGTFIRGRWKAGGSVHPSFVSAGHGKFDFYSPHIMGIVEEQQGPRIQNVSGNLYFWVKRKRLGGSPIEVAGVYNKDLGEVCFVGCVQPEFQRFQAQPPGETGNSTNSTFLADRLEPVYVDSDEACTIHGLMALSHKKGRLQSATGALSSLRHSNETGYFSTLTLDGKIVISSDQRNLFRWDLFIRSSIFAIEAVILTWQIFQSIRSPSSYFVSMLMIIVQIVAMCFLSGYLLYIPLRLLTVKRFKYLLSGVNLVPWLVLTLVILLNVVFLLVILRKRMVARRLKVEGRPQEVLLAIICMIIYAVTGVGVSSTHNFETYVQVVWCWFLLPQVIANVFWDLRLKPLHWVYVVGVSLLRIAYIGFNAVRPTIYGFDDLNDFPQGWFWGITGTVSFFGSYALLQQSFGGRAFLPQRWFGYKQLPGSKGDADHQEKSFDLEADRILDDL